MLVPKSTSRTVTVAVVGAGELVSHLRRSEDADDPVKYQFSVLRLTQDLKVTRELRPCDLHDVVKLCQVLAFAIVDDGRVLTETSDSLQVLLAELDDLTRRWSDTDHG